MSLGLVMQRISGAVRREEGKIKDGGDIFSTFFLSLSLRCYSDHFVSSASGTLVIFGSWLLWQLVAAVSYSLTSHTVKIWSPQQHGALSKHSSSVYTNTRNNREGLRRGRMGATWEGITSTCLFFEKKKWQRPQPLTHASLSRSFLKGSYHANKSLPVSMRLFFPGSSVLQLRSWELFHCISLINTSTEPGILGSWENVPRKH